MSDNAGVVERYMEGFRRGDREAILACLADDVEWVLPGMFHVRGKEAFAGHIVDEGFAGRPEITVDRLVEQGDVVVAEGRVRAPRAEGPPMELVFCDVFDFAAGRIRKLVSYLMELKPPAG
jgi:ketosteroid isomerase-like protein